jgi:hypothetical protein
VVVCIAAAAVLALAGYRGITTIHDEQQPTLIKTAAASTNMQACLARRVVQVVPAGATIALAPTTPFFEQRLTEWSAPSIRVVTNRALAQYLVRVKRVHGARCDGLDVVADRL